MAKTVTEIYKKTSASAGLEIRLGNRKAVPPKPGVEKGSVEGDSEKCFYGTNGGGNAGIY